ncbi:two pore domain potassium channel family protein [Synechococcus sp. Tobar12-5m-g]|uniref:potassium channel family protein n=1 Tax=unclassified Synechococcus TaxID=2626047 RepID=UPI0020CF9903|nr:MULTISPECIES: potassium channel family protein [unclassified Synechococcus]MCP9771502.1 two pore domain potassium channel family protein [Synechococcus sp. Tobar12-5m-g]MCP9872441.1 two pore domain potassium channel family protein [Synechococcus sp. Cruz CV-v-12]
MDAPRPFDPSPRARIRRRHRFFLQLFIVCVLLLSSFTLPLGWNRLSILGQIVMVALLMVHLGAPRSVPGSSRLGDHVFRALGIAALVSVAIWVLTPISWSRTGVPMLALWSLFMAWSQVRLVVQLAQEREVNGRVLMGAFAGYLMLGLTAGLLMSVLETVHPGSFTSVHHQGGQLLVPHQVNGVRVRAQQVWELDFVRLNYFAFVSLTTVGFGDILPVTPVAQISSVSFSVIGPFYLAVVMGVMISRFTIQEANAAEREELQDDREA